MFKQEEKTKDKYKTKEVCVQKLPRPGCLLKIMDWYQISSLLLFVSNIILFGWLMNVVVGVFFLGGGFPPVILRT